MGKIFVCSCEDVTVEDIHRAIALGYDDIESLKRYTTTGTGFCQGKSCLISLAKILMEHHHLTELQPTTPRPPIHPTMLKFFAAEEET